MDANDGKERVVVVVLIIHDYLRSRTFRIPALCALPNMAATKSGGTFPRA